MCTAPVKAIALQAVYRVNLEFQSHLHFAHARYIFAHAWTPRVLHFSAFIHLINIIRTYLYTIHDI